MNRTSERRGEERRGEERRGEERRVTFTLVLFADFPILKELKESKLVDFSAFEHCWETFGIMYGPGCFCLF